MRLLLERLALRLLPLLLLLAPLWLQLVLLMLLLVLLVRLLQQLLLLVLEFLLLLLPLLSLLIVRLPPRLRPAAQLRRGRGTVNPTITRSMARTTPCLTYRSQAPSSHLPLLALLLQQVPLLPPLVSRIPRLRSLQRQLALQRLLRVVHPLMTESAGPDRRRLLQAACRP